jgi:energy-coupling factor transporter ATP-binding protein EcfA2
VGLKGQPNSGFGSLGRDSQRFEMNMSVLQQILEWSKDRPNWQRDAFRRLIVAGDLGDKDIRELAAICKSDYGLAEKAEAQPLTKEHVPSQVVSAAAVSLESIYHHKGVNALADEQTLKFSPRLTIVYGDNGAGKTGYTRILKQACRARGAEQILGNVVSGTAPTKPVVAIKYKVGADPNSKEWSGGDIDDFVSRVSVFDTQSATVYLKEKTNVAFLPFGLDLFDKLVKGCKAVRATLEDEQKALITNTLTVIAAQIPEGTIAAKLLANINSLTKPEIVQAVTRLAPDEEARRVLLEKTLLDLQANDPEKLVRQLTLRGGRARSLADHLAAVESALAVGEIESVFRVRADGRRKSEEAKRLREATLPEGMLSGTGGDRWKGLWEEARHFSKEQAYPEKVFPFVDDGARCVLCQQDLDHAAAHRLKKFEEFIASTTERELRQLRQEFAKRRDALTALKTSNEAVEETLRELRLEHEEAADTIAAAIQQNEKRRVEAVKALSENGDLSPDCPAVAGGSTDAIAVSKEIEARIKSLRESGNDDLRKKMAAELKELQARVALGKHEAAILEEIERKKKIAAYAQCLDETKPTAITQKGSAVTKAVVTDRLKDSFRDELRVLGFTQVEVELKEAGGSEGVFYHRLVLTRAPGVDLPKVVSEGEQRCLSIAAFFAELSTADDPSGIVFDDPVSSLDFAWRHAVAKRLVEESKKRQVIVFTHDIVFLLALKQFADELGVEALDQHVRYSSKGAGQCQEELPWVAMPVKKRIGHLMNEWASVDKLSREGFQDAYEKEAKNLYGLLREAWERALEEVLLAGIVERYRPSVQTLHVSVLADITAEDCKTVESAMTKCSTWLRGHDQAPAARAPVPNAAQLKADIEALKEWVAAIHKRRKN